MSEFITYRKIIIPEEALYFTNLFTEHGIEYEIEDNSPPVDITFSYSTLNNDIRIKLRPEDFARADELIKEESPNSLEIDDDYYLHGFTNEELIDIIKRYDEWSMEDFMLAQELLKKRGADISQDDIEEWKGQRLAELRIPQKTGNGLGAGYVFAILGGVSIIGTVIGFGMGLYYMRAKRNLPNGEQMHLFDEASRTKGKHLMIFSILWFVMVIIAVIVAITMMENKFSN